MSTFAIDRKAGIVSIKTPPGAVPWRAGTNAELRDSAAYQTDDTNMLAGINSSNGVTKAIGCGANNLGASPVGTWLIRFGFNLGQSIISLDGGPLIPYTELPSGMIISAAQLKVNYNRFVNVNYDPLGHFYLQTNQQTESADFGQTDDLTNIHTATFNYPLNTTLPLLMLLNDGFGIRTTYGSAGFYGQEYFNARVSGTYSLWSFTYNIDTPAVNTIGPNNKIRITSTYPAAGALDLSKIITNGIDSTTGTYNPLADTGIAGVGLIWINLAGVPQFYYIPIRYIDFEPDLLEFEIPPPFRKLIWKDPTIPGWPVVPVTPIIYGNGTQFSGWVNLTPLTVTLVDASGVYRLVKDKTNDTLYDQIAPISTYNVKIPNPFIKTGFIGG